MNEIEGLIRAYEDFVCLPWDQALSGPEKVWFAIYDPVQERRLRLRVSDFEVATKAAGHGWVQLDLTDAFAEWMAKHEYREAYFEQPEDMDLALQEFEDYLIGLIQVQLTASEADENTMVAILGVATFFGLTHVSKIIKSVNAAIQGRLLVFFPGSHEGSNFRLLDARDGWNYLAIVIKASEKGSRE